MKINRDNVNLTFRIAYDSASGKSGEILLPSCDQLNDELTMSFEDSTSKRSLSLIGNTNVRIIQKGLDSKKFLLPGIHFCRQ